MIQTMKSFKRVCFEDCDPFSHLNNANYLNYFLSAREEQLRKNEVLSIFDHAKESGESWAVRSHDIRYLKPAILGEELEVWSRMLCFDNLRNLVEFVLYCPENNELKAVMHSQFVYFTIKDGRPKAIDQKMNDLFEKISLFAQKRIKEFNVDQRIKEIKSEIRENY